MTLKFSSWLNAFVQRARLLVDRRRRVLQVVRADDRGVPAGVAAAEPTLLQHRHIGDAVVPAEVVGRRQPVPTRADDDHAVAAARLGRCPRRGPSPCGGGTPRARWRRPSSASAVAPCPVRAHQSLEAARALPSRSAAARGPIATSRPVEAQPRGFADAPLAIQKLRSGGGGDCDMMFWFVSGGDGAGVSAAIVALPALARRKARRATGARDVDVYRDQLAEIERDLARGVIDSDEAERIRVEVSRRLLDADRKAQAATAGAAPAPRWVSVALAALSPCCSSAAASSSTLRSARRATGHADRPPGSRRPRPRAPSRPDQAEAEARMEEMPSRGANPPRQFELMDPASGRGRGPAGRPSGAHPSGAQRGGSRQLRRRPRGAGAGDRTQGWRRDGR